MKPLVSIIVPVYNADKYLIKCLDSLVNQTFRNIEVIVINDGSSDSSETIINQFKSNYPEIIKSYYKLNGGIADVRNFGLKHVNSPYFGFLDSDDYIELNAIEEMYNAAISNNLDIVMSDFYWTYPEYEKITNDGPYNNNKELLVSMFATLWNKLYRTEFIRSINVQFPKGYRYEDASFLYKIIPYIEKWDYINKPFVHYVQRIGSITHNHNERVKDMIFVFEDLIDFYKERNLYEKYKLELEYLFVRFFLGNSFLRSTQIKDKDDRDRTLKLSFELLNKTFPKWRNNSLLKRFGLKNVYYRTINQVTYSIYSELFYLYFRFLKKDKLV